MIQGIGEQRSTDGAEISQAVFCAAGVVALDNHVVADEGVVTVEVAEVTLLLDDAVADVTVFEFAVVADGGMGANDAVFQRYAIADEAGFMDGNGLIEACGRSSELLRFVDQYALVGENGGCVVSAIEPFVYGTGNKLHAFGFHVFHGIGELVLAFFADVVVDEVLDFRLKGFAAFEVVNANDG